MEKQLKRAGAAAMLLAALVILIIGDPTLAEELKAAEPELAKILAARSHHVDPWEVYEASHNNRMKLLLLDLRETRDFNLFHLYGAKRITAERLDAAPLFPLKATAIVLMSSDEAEAERAWRRLYVRGQENAYIMAGGVNAWLDIFRPELCAATGGDPGLWLLDAMHLNPCHGYGHHPHFNPHVKLTLKGDDTLRHRFEEARGDALPWSTPPELHGEAAHARHFDKKIKLIGAVAKKAGGCG